METFPEVTGGAWKASQSGSELKNKLSMLLFSVLIIPLPSRIREQIISIQPLLTLCQRKHEAGGPLASITENK